MSGSEILSALVVLVALFAAAIDEPSLALVAFGAWALTALLGRMVRRAR